LNSLFYFFININFYDNVINTLIEFNFQKMNIIIIIIITIFSRNQNAKKKLKTKIKKYLHRVNIVENSKTFALLRNTIALLDEA
jgi:cadmium resistance protein CadD (predicted permease)